MGNISATDRYGEPIHLGDTVQLAENLFVRGIVQEIRADIVSIVYNNKTYNLWSKNTIKL